MNGTAMWTVTILVAAGLATGCGNGDRAEAERRAKETADGARDAAARAGEAAQDAVAATREAIDKAGDSDAAQQAGEMGAAATAAAADLTRAAARAAAGGALTAAIKTALMADRNIDASGIDVDTDEQARLVTLKGRVATPAQRTAAVAVARTKAVGYEIRDQLVVGQP